MSLQLFEDHPPEIQREWKLYVEKMDKRLGDALKKAVRTSLQVSWRAFGKLVSFLLFVQKTIHASPGLPENRQLPYSLLA